MGRWVGTQTITKTLPIPDAFPRDPGPDFGPIPEVILCAFRHARVAKLTSSPRPLSGFPQLVLLLLDTLGIGSKALKVKQPKVILITG